MKLVEIIASERIEVDLEARSKQEAMTELVELLVRSGAVPESARGAVMSAVSTREESHSTGVGQGVALPHGAVDVVRDLVGALGVSRDGVEFDSLDGKPAHLILLTVVPRNKLQAHVKTLPGIARLLNKSELRERLRTAPNAASVMSILRAEEGSDDEGDEDFIGRR